MVDIGLSLITIGLYASNAHLFPLPAVFLTGPALASGIAWVNSVGILGGSVSPPVMGWLKDYTGSYSGGLYALAGFALLAAFVSAMGARDDGAKADRRRNRGCRRITYLSRCHAAFNGSA